MLHPEVGMPIKSREARHGGTCIRAAGICRRIEGIYVELSDPLAMRIIMKRAITCKMLDEKHILVLDSISCVILQPINTSTYLQELPD